MRPLSLPVVTASLALRCWPSTLPGEGFKSADRSADVVLERLVVDSVKSFPGFPRRVGCDWEADVEFNATWGE